jgi:hypothetical protein
MTFFKTPRNVFVIQRSVQKDRSKRLSRWEGIMNYTSPVPKLNVRVESAAAFIGIAANRPNSVRLRSRYSIAGVSLPVGSVIL